MNKHLLNLIAEIPVVRDRVAKQIFLGRNHNTHRLMGIFRSYEDALAHVPKNFVEGPDEHKIFLDVKDGVLSSHREIVRILSGLMPQTKTLFDLGGNVGYCFYEFRSELVYPPDFIWTSSDLPVVNAAGRKLALERGATQIVFTDDRTDASGTDIYLTTGALQYLEKPLAGLLEELKEKPKHILVSRVPMTNRTSFYTLQHTGHSILPYYYANYDSFVSSIKAAGYDLVETWKTERGSEIILHPEVDVQKYYGFHFVRV